jgi:hypothetical protein
MKILGIDPGIHGDAAIVHITDGEAPQLLDARWRRLPPQRSWRTRFDFDGSPSF